MPFYIVLTDVLLSGDVMFTEAKDTLISIKKRIWIKAENNVF